MVRNRQVPSERMAGGENKNGKWFHDFKLGRRGKCLAAYGVHRYVIWEK
jgi:hypothetical protein